MLYINLFKINQPKIKKELNNCCKNGIRSRKT